MFTKRFLSEVRREALRKRVWWSALDTLERGILTLAAKITQQVKNPLLSLQLVKIIAKIKKTSPGILANRIREFGEQKAYEISRVGARFASKVSPQWANEGFARYLAFMSLNAPAHERLSPTILQTEITLK